MILIVTNREDYTADFAILEMQRRGIFYVRFNTEDFPQATTVTAIFGDSGIEGHFNTGKGRVHFNEIESVWFRRPVLPVPSSEIEDPAARQFCVIESLAYLEALWRSLDCFWVSKPDSIRAAESKLLQLTVAEELGFSIPRTLVTCDPSEARAFFENIDKIVYKPLRQGRLEYGDTTTLIFTNVVTDRVASQFDRVKYAPCLFQEYVVKGVEIRITAFGAQVFATEIHSQTDERAIDDWRRSGALTLPYSPHELPAWVEKKCILLLQRLDLVFGAIDMILTPGGEYVFLEINPNGQWAWIEQLTGVPMSRSLVDLLVKGRG